MSYIPNASTLPAPRCEVCGRGGPGLTELPDGRPVHRWPCRDRLRDAR